MAFERLNQEELTHWIEPKLRELAFQHNEPLPASQPHPQRPTFDLVEIDLLAFHLQFRLCWVFQMTEILYEKIMTRM